MGDVIQFPRLADEVHNSEPCACGHPKYEHYNDSGAESFCHAGECDCEFFMEKEDNG